MRLRTVAIFVLAALSTSFGSRLKSDEPEKLSERELREKVIEAKTFRDAGEAFARYFKEVGRRSLEVLKRDPDTTIALQAAWESLTVVMPEDLNSSRDADTLPQRVLRDGDAQRFFGFLEGRTGLEIPNWWEGRRNFPSRDKGPDWQLTEFEETDVVLRKGSGKLKLIKPRFGTKKNSAELVDERLVLTIGSQKLTVGKEVVETWKKGGLGGGQFDVHVKKERSYVAIYDDFGLAFPLYCIETDTGKLLWKGEVWGQRLAASIFTGVGYYHEVELEVGDERIAVWGAGLYGSYLECFDAKTGAVKFRFSTEY